MTENPDTTHESETPQASSSTSPADADHSEPDAGGTESEQGISDDQLPEDLRPTEDNPLAQPLDPDDEATKDRDELEMDATQENLGNDDGASQAPNQAGDTASGGGAGQATQEPDASTEDTSAKDD